MSMAIGQKLPHEDRQHEWIRTMSELSGNPTFISIFIATAILCALDILTTNYAVSNAIGYESNMVLAGMLSRGFYMFKYFATLAIVVGIGGMCNGKHRKLEMTSYATLLSFYAIVVLNNMLEIFANTDLDLNLPKLFLIFGLLFILFGLVNAKRERSKTFQPP